MYQLLTAVTGTESLLVIDKEQWKLKRRTFNPGFSPKFLKGMVRTIADKLERLKACIDRDIAEGASTNMLKRSQTFTSDVIVAVAFGEDWNADEHPAVQCTFTECFRPSQARILDH